MRSWTFGVAFSILLAGLLAVVLAVLMVDSVEAAPRQPNVPLFTYGSR